MFLKLQINNQTLEISDYMLIQFPTSNMCCKNFQTAELKESYHEYLYTNHLDYIINLY